MPKFTKQMKVELSGTEIEDILEDHVRGLMRKEGYTLDYSRNESEAPMPDMMYRGIFDNQRGEE